MIRLKAYRGKVKKVFVAMSGGVDSSVAALLLKQKGYDVVGVFMKNWTEARPNFAGSETSGGQGCEWKEDRRDAMAVCAKLDILFLTFDFTKEYRKEIIDYMVKEYLAGRTPNPDVMCNKKIKFGLFLKKAREMGADFIATGHYVRLGVSVKRLAISEKKAKTLNPKRYTLYAARDAQKDQSYFLWTLTQNQLKYCLFPIGDYLKSEVREIARKIGLSNAQKKDSQGLCFVGKVKFRDFLSNLISQKFNKNSRPRIFVKNKMGGKIKTTDGKIIGEHKGLEFYTIGQRHGLGIGGGAPYFVAEKDIKNNTLIVACKNDPALYKKEIFVKNLNWIFPTALGELYSYYSSRRAVIKRRTRIRYRQPLQGCKVFAISKNRLKIIFEKPVWAVAPGQSAVFYKNFEMLGGGVIDDKNMEKFKNQRRKNS